MSISDSNYLNSVKSDINKLGYKTYVNKRGKWHIVYAGPFKNNTEASKALSAIKRDVSKDAFLTKVNVTTPKQKVKKQIVPVQKKVVVAPVKVQEKKKITKKVVPEKILPAKQKTTPPSVEKITPKKIVPIQKKPTLSSAQKQDVAPKVKIQEKKNIVPVQQSTKSRKEAEEKGFYIGLEAGYSIVGITRNDTNGGVPLNFGLKDSGISYGAEMGYYFNNNVFISINYQKTDLKDVTSNNMFTTLNYQLDEINSLYPYIGVIAGYNTITWETSPIDYATGNSSASSLLGGLQIGSDISFYDGVSFSIFYRYLMISNTTNIEVGAGKSSIEYTSEQNLNVGIKYNF